jgi:hypothetical protein
MMAPSSGSVTGPPDLPALPPRAEPALLREMDDAALLDAEAELGRVERATRSAMAPWDRQLREIRARREEIATERRRRERAERHAARMAVRERAGSETMPTLSDALLAEPSPLGEERPLAAVRAYLASGGEVGFGYPTRPGSLGFTDGRRLRSAVTWGEARRLYAEGWEPGAPGTPGVRVHLVGTRVERVVGPTEVLVDLG